MRFHSRLQTYFFYSFYGNLEWNVLSKNYENMPEQAFDLLRNGSINKLKSIVSLFSGLFFLACAFIYFLI